MACNNRDRDGVKSCQRGFLRLSNSSRTSHSLVTRENKNSMLVQFFPPSFFLLFLFSLSFFFFYRCTRVTMLSRNKRTVEGGEVQRILGSIRRWPTRRFNNNDHGSVVAWNALYIYTRVCVHTALIFITTRVTLSHSADEQWRAWLCRPETTTFRSYVYGKPFAFSIRHGANIVVAWPWNFYPLSSRGYLATSIDQRFWDIIGIVLDHTRIYIRTFSPAG